MNLLILDIFNLVSKEFGLQLAIVVRLALVSIVEALDVNGRSDAVSLSSFEVLSEVLVSAPVGGGKAVFTHVLALRVEVGSLLLERHVSAKIRLGVGLFINLGKFTRDQRRFFRHSIPCGARHPFLL
jgi:hypothetical protein